MTKLFHVAFDEPFDNDDPEKHNREYIYLAYLDDADIVRLRHETVGRVSLWQAEIISVDDLIARAKWKYLADEV
jgi:hypothetical protein